MAEPSDTTGARPAAKPYLDEVPAYAVSETVADIKARYQLSDVVYLASNENPYGCSPQVTSTLMQELESGHRYPDGAGRELKTALSQAFSVDSGQILLGNGSNEILDCVIKAFLGPGDEMLVSAHSFGMYPIMAKWVGADVVQVPMRQWQIDLDAVAGQVGASTRLILLANANNPTGTMVSQAEIEAFLAQVPSDVLVVIDEAYIEFADPDLGHALALINRHSNLFVCRTFSKAYGLAGFRIGYGVGPQEIISVLEKVRQPFNVNMLALKAALAAFTDNRFLADCVSRNHRERSRITAFLDQAGLECLPSQANFLAFRVPQDAAAAYESLLTHGVIVRRLTSYGMSDWMRVSIGNSQENDRFMQAMSVYQEGQHAE